MSTSDLPVPHTNLSPITRALQLTQGLPLWLVTLLERRYLNDFQPQLWQIAPRTEDIALPLLHEVVELGKPSQERQWVHTMPAVLTACHEPGHALLMVLHGQGNRHRLYFGGRRMIGMGARSTEDYLSAQESALKAHFTGLQMNAAGPFLLSHQDLPEMAELLQTAPALSLITGIPSGRDGEHPLDIQSIDRLVKAVGTQRFVLMVVAEPLDAHILDTTLDVCRHLRSEIRTYTRRTISCSQSRSEGVTHTQIYENDISHLPVYLAAMTTFLRFVLPPPMSAMLGIAAAGTTILGAHISTDIQARSHQMQQSSSWQESESLELLDANAEACEQLLQSHIERLNVARSSGWWRTAIYIAAESEAAQYSVIGALRSLGSGNATALEPLRVLSLPSYTLREVVRRGQILHIRPQAGTQGHPLGPSFEALATCISSEELAVIVNVPQQELPGLPMYERSHFALSVPPATPQSISLGILQDSLGRNLSSVFITAEELNRHCFVTGITGYGKTNTCMHILLEAYEKLGVPFLVVEPAKTEYQRLTQIARLREELRVYSLGGDSALPFRLNPLQPVPGIPLGRHIDLLKAVFNASFPMFAGMPYVLEEAILDIYTEYGWSFYTSQNASLSPYASLSERSALLPNLQDLHDRIEIVLAKKKYGQEIHQNMGAALRARLQSLMKGNKGLALNTRRSVPLEDLFAKPTVIELQNLGDDEEKAFLMALLFTLLYEYAETRQASFPIEQRGRLQHLTLIEEAHRLLRATSGHINPEIGDPRAKAVMMFTDMLAEMRAYGEGFIIADQIPNKLAPETLKNSNLKIVHRLAAPDDRQATGDCMNLTESQMRHLNTLSPGMAVVHSERIGEAVLTKIHPTKDTRAPDHLARGERQQWEMLKREDKIYLYRHAGCRSCPNPCNFYHWVEEATSRGEEMSPSALRAFFESMLVDQVENAWQQWTMWRSARQEYDASPQSQEFVQGRLYCIVTQAAYTWLGELLIDRGLAVRKERKLLPGERLIREQAAQVLSELLLIWSRKTQLDAEGRNVFAATQQHVRRLIAKVPLREQPGCVQCPIRCLALPFVAPHIRPLEKPVATKLAENLSSDTKLEIIRRTTEQQIKTLGNHRGNQVFCQGTLYCLLTNIQVSPEVLAKRDELLILLR